MNRWKRAMSRKNIWLKMNSLICCESKRCWALWGSVVFVGWSRDIFRVVIGVDFLVSFPPLHSPRIGFRD